MKKKVKSKGYACPHWFMSIKPGAHGNTPAQKRLWRVVSEKYRQDDWNTYGPHCAVCGAFLETWEHGQLGHFHRYSLCNGWFKYERRNMAMICAGCNMNDGGLTSFKFAEALRIRYGEDIILWIEQENQRHRGEKLEDWMIVDYAATVDPSRVY